MAISTTNGESLIERPAPVSATSLPSSRSPDVELVVATQAEHMQTSRLNGDEWRGPLTIEQYLKREKHLLAQNMTKDGKEVAWILTSPTLPTDEYGNRAVLASCETIPVQAYVARDGRLQQTLAHGIGSVFTRPEHRGKSYASRMMIDLGKKLETFQQHNGDRSQLSVLYSDIGQKFYSRFGWKAFSSTHIHLVPIASEQYSVLSTGLPVVEDLTVDGLDSLPATGYVKEELLAASKKAPGSSFVAIAPDTEHFAWHHAREEFVSKALSRPAPKTKGAIHRETGTSLVWNRTYAAEKQAWMLHILHVAIPPSLKTTAEVEQALAALLLRAQHEAYQSEMAGGVEVWDPSEEILSAAQHLQKDVGDRVEVTHRDTDHICSLRWSGPEPDGHDVVWMFRQKYAWC